MKIALCFIISYDHILNKEELWREWIEPNKDIIHVYFYYKDLKKIKSPWILQHALPQSCIYETSYYHVIPAYLSLMQHALKYDNQWMCFLTDSCCPIVSPQRFRSLFYEYWDRSIMSWKPAWWNVIFHKRANLALLPIELRLANDPWFVLKREHAAKVLHFSRTQVPVVKTICDGGLANESLFAIILYGYKQLTRVKGSNVVEVINGVTHLADWSRMASATSPHIFKEGDTRDIRFLETNLPQHKCVMFFRKVSPDFPDDILRKYIYKKDDSLMVPEPFVFLYRRLLAYLWLTCGVGTMVISLLYGLQSFFF
jgi:hypothetical protein